MDGPRLLMLVWMLVGPACNRSITPIRVGDETDILSTVRAYDDAWRVLYLARRSLGSPEIPGVTRIAPIRTRIRRA